MRRVLVANILLWSIFCVAKAQNASHFTQPIAVSLQTLMDSAFQNNPIIKDNENKLRLAELNLKQSVAELASPKVYVQSDLMLAPYLNNNGGFISAKPGDKAIGYDANVSNGGLYSATANASLPLLTSAGKMAYRNDCLAQKASFSNQIELTKHELTLQITNQYIVSYLSQVQMTYVQNAISLLIDQKEVVKTLVVKGLAKQTDYLLMGIEIQNQQINLAQYLSDYADNFLQLKSLCGIKDTAVVQIATPNIEALHSNVDSKFLQMYKSDSLQIIASQNVYNLKYKPSLNLYANTGLNAVELPGIQRKFGWSAGLTFNWMLYDGKQKQLEQQKNAILLNTTETYKASFLKQHDVQKVNAMNKMKALEHIITQKKQQLKDFEEIMNMYKIQLSQGQLSVIDYLNAIRNYNDLLRDTTLAETNKMLAINEYNYLNW